MSKWVDADALKAFIRNQYFQCDMPEEWGNGVMWATSQINHYCNKAPSIDIVKCKECVHGTWHKQTEMYICSVNDQDLYEAEHFCSYGEREGE